MLTQYPTSFITQSVHPSEVPAGITQIDYDLFDPKELASKDLGTRMPSSPAGPLHRFRTPQKAMITKRAPHKRLSTPVRVARFSSPARAFPADALTPSQGLSSTWTRSDC